MFQIGKLFINRRQSYMQRLVCIMHSYRLVAMMMNVFKYICNCRWYIHRHKISIDSVIHVHVFYSVIINSKYGSLWTATHRWNEQQTQYCWRVMAKLCTYVFFIYRFPEYSTPVIWKYLPLVTPHTAFASSHNLFVTSSRLKWTSFSVHTERLLISSEFNIFALASPFPPYIILTDCNYPW
jgi:hypothetical protein